MISQEIEAELSYAYLHAVAAKGGVKCQVGSRLFDNDGIDATLQVARDFGPDAILTDFSVHVQLKATTQDQTNRNGLISYLFKGIDRYDRLRAVTVLPPKLVVVLFLPHDARDWLQHSPEQLVMKRCAYWVSLRGAPATENTDSITIRIPETQIFSPDGLANLLKRIACQEDLCYVG